MILQVGCPKRRLCGTDFSRRRREACRRHAASGELALEIGLLRDQPLPNQDCLRLHSLEERLYAAPLRISQPEWLIQFENVARTGMPIELGHKSRPHAAAGLQVCTCSSASAFTALFSSPA